jgi:hypothetical protein
MKTNRIGITRLTTGQCSGIAGGDPGMVLAGSGMGGVGSGGGFSGANMALAGMGIGIEGGPMAVVAIGLPAEAPFTTFDKWLTGATASAAGGATTAFVAGLLEGAAIGAAFTPVGAVIGVAVAAAVYYGTSNLIQHANNETAYAGHVRHAIP